MMLQSLIPLVGLPEGRTLASYFSGVFDADAGMMIGGVLIIAFVYLTMVRHDRNFSQAIGYLIIIVVAVFMVFPGDDVFREVIKALGRLVWDWLTH